MSKGSLSYRPDIDGLRAIAVLAVVGYHAFPGHFPGGFFGVDIFFVISGFLITSLLVSEVRQTGHISFGNFYARRVRRLFPAMLLVLSSTTLAGAYLLFAHEFARLVEHVWASLFFVENLLLASESGYFDVGSYEKPLLHFWSLAVEEQFYLVWPLLLISLSRFKGGIPIGISAIILASLTVTFFVAMSPPWHFYSPLNRAWELGAGALLACTPVDRLRDRLSLPVQSLISLASLTAIAAAVLTASETLQHPGAITFVPVLATIALLAIDSRAIGNQYALSLRPAVWIGLISYPLYLWHWPLLSYLAIVSAEERGPPLARLVMVILACALAAMTYLLVERPLRRRLPLARSVKLTAGAAALFCIILAVANLFEESPSDRKMPLIQKEIEGVDWQFSSNPLCDQEFGSDYTAFCVASRPGQPDVLLFGESYANHLYPGLAQAKPFRNKAIVGIGVCEISGTFPEIYDDCGAQKALLESMNPGGVVVVANQWPVFDSAGKMIDIQDDDPGTPDQYPLIGPYRTAMQEAIATIASTKQTIILVGAKPELGYDVADCFGRPLRAAKRNCSISRIAFEKDGHRTNDLLRDLAAEHPNVYFFDLAGVFCGQTECSFIDDDGLPLLRDDNGHLSVRGSRLVAHSFIRWAEEKNLLQP